MCKVKLPSNKKKIKVVARKRKNKKQEKTT